MAKLETVIFMTENQDINVATKEMAEKATRLINKEHVPRNAIVEYNTNTWNENDIWHCRLTFTYWIGSFIHG